MTGAQGRLARELVAQLTSAGANHVTAAARAQLDITDEDAVRAAVGGHDVVVNTAAFTDVDAAERNESQALAVNGAAVAGLARSCARTGATLLQISSDYVLAGNRESYAEGDRPDPINAYGRSKAAAEEAVSANALDGGYIIRTSWLYGGTGDNFLIRSLRATIAGEPVYALTDQRGCPTSTAALSRQLMGLGAAAVRGEAPPGIYHGVATGFTTWHHFVQSAYQLAGLATDGIMPIRLADLPLRAARPLHCVLSHERWRDAGVPIQPHWREQLREMLGRPAYQSLIGRARAISAARRNTKGEIK
ncbi:dTDP-4-dehydrorhamnose reductase [Actinoplanes sp. NPDC026619]|uniref:dTDP-4-dehydrorhamnose reductase n=1 Tax=Actinoplanes sp. NPDC026619 TaxID=3155798 RepID=UPI0033EC9D9E